MVAGLQVNSVFSTASSRADIYAAKSVLQKRHLTAAALMVSPHTGQTFVSSLMFMFHASHRGRKFGTRRCDWPASPGDDRTAEYSTDRRQRRNPWSGSVLHTNHSVEDSTNRQRLS